MESTGERCESCRRPSTFDVMKWWGSASKSDGFREVCGAGANKDAHTECLRATIALRSLLIDKADRLVQKVMALRSDKDNWEKEREVYEAMVDYRAARAGVPVEAWKVLTKVPNYSGLPDGPLFPEVKK